MQISIDFIQGIAVGLEIVNYPENDFNKTLIIDILVIRILIQW